MHHAVMSIHHVSYLLVMHLLVCACEGVLVSVSPEVTIDWNVIPSTKRLSITISTDIMRGWVGFGVAQSSLGNMVGSDSAIVFFSNGKVELDPYKLEGKSTSDVEKRQLSDKTNWILERYYTDSKGNHVQISKSQVPSYKDGIAILPNQQHTFIWAARTHKKLGYHNTRGAFNVLIPPTPPPSTISPTAPPTASLPPELPASFVAIPSSPLTFHWRLRRSTIEMALRCAQCNNVGYIAFGISSNDYMIGSDVSIFYDLDVEVHKPEFRIEEYHLFNYSKQGFAKIVPPNSFNAEVHVTGEEVLLSWERHQRSLTSMQDNLRLPITLPITTFCWAMGRSGPGVYYHGMERGILAVNLTDAKGVIASSPNTSMVTLPPTEDDTKWNRSTSGGQGIASFPVWHLGWIIPLCALFLMVAILLIALWKKKHRQFPVQAVSKVFRDDNWI